MELKIGCGVGVDRPRRGVVAAVTRRGEGLLNASG